MAKERLQKILAAAGIDSRRNCEQLILDGAVSVNGHIVDSLPVFADPETDIIKVHGKKLKSRLKVYYLLNKPKNVICTNRDPQGRKTAVDIIGSRERIFCAGRLDADTTGAIILTNDTELVNILTHPKFGLHKTYVATVKGLLTPEHVEKLRKGIWLAEGKTSKASVKLLNAGPQQSTLEITISEGMNRQIRRMLARLDFKVKNLKRTKIGKITLHGLGSGNWRKLDAYEIKYLKGLLL